MQLANTTINSPDRDRDSKIEAFLDLKSWLDNSQVSSASRQLADFPDFESHSADAVRSSDLKITSMRQFKESFEKASSSSNQLSHAGIELIQELLRALKRMIRISNDLMIGSKRP